MVPRREPSRARSALETAWQTARRFSFAIAFVIIVGGAATFGALHEAAVRDQGFDQPSGSARTPTPVPASLADDQRPGESARELFVHACGTCHTLRAAHAGAGIGPILDKVRPRLAVRRVRDQIRTGTVDSAMPANLLLGRDANRVASYVARVAGRRR